MEGNKELYYEYQKNYHKKIREIKQRVANGQKIRVQSLPPIPSPSLRGLWPLLGISSPQHIKSSGLGTFSPTEARQGSLSRRTYSTDRQQVL